MTTDQTARIAETLAKLAGQITKAREFQVIRRNRDDGDIEYQIFADTDVPWDGCQIAWVQSTKADAEFIAFAFTHADLLTTLQAERAWRPIASAPKDGRLVLLYPSRYWCEDVNCDAEVGYWDIDANEWLSGCRAAEDYTGPTHWLPLPDPPASSEDVASQEIPK